MNYCKKFIINNSTTCYAFMVFIFSANEHSHTGEKYNKETENTACFTIPRLVADSQRYLQPLKSRVRSKRFKFWRIKCRKNAIILYFFKLKFCHEEKLQASLNTFHAILKSLFKLILTLRFAMEFHLGSFRRKKSLNFIINVWRMALET